MALPQEKEFYTHQDYRQWDDGERWELIGGVVYDMSPAPDIRHQGILLNLTRLVGNALYKKPCIPRFAPTDVVLSNYDVVQPDLLIVCDRKKITEKNIQGAPDAVFEIISPSTSKKDRWEKKALYEKFSVKEYIVVFPDGEYAERYFLQENGEYDKGEVLEKKDTLLLKSVPGLEIPLPEVFEFDIEEESLTVTAPEK